MIAQKFGHYRIDSKLGEGGMGVVYRACDEQLKRDIARKVLSAGVLSNQAARKRFRQEALALSQLNHPHICTIYEVGESGQSYIAMEHIPGTPLSALVRGCLSRLSSATASRSPTDWRTLTNGVFAQHLGRHINTAGENISDAQVKSQIAVLNKDYRATNTDKSKVPSVWKGLVTDAGIEFALATKDPQGNPSTGITRTQIKPPRPAFRRMTA